MSKALVISTTKYGENDLIANCLLEELGLQTFMLKGILKSKRGALRPAHFQLLMQLNVEIAPQKKSAKTINYLKNVQVAYAYKTLYSNPVKQSILFFLSELLKKIIQTEKEPNKNFFDYITTALKWLDLNEKTAHFHLVFMIKLTRFLGFFPNTKNIKNDYFDMSAGDFSAQNTGGEYHLCKTQTSDLKKLINCDFESDLNFLSHKSELTEMLCNYFKLHLQGFQTPKSIGVLKMLLR